MTTTSSIVRQNYHEECEAGINRQINMELYASYVYMSMVSEAEVKCTPDWRIALYCDFAFV